jgi:hypothetical protein
LNFWAHSFSQSTLQKIISVLINSSLNLCMMMMSICGGRCGIGWCLGVEDFVRLVYFTLMTVITLVWFIYDNKHVLYHSCIRIMTPVDLYMTMNMFCITVVSQSWLRLIYIWQWTCFVSQLYHNHDSGWLIVFELLTL